MAPVVAGVAAIVGLYFGISGATASRTQQAEADTAEAAAHETALKIAAVTEPGAARSVIDSPRERPPP